MKVDVGKLRGKIVEKGLTQSHLAGIMSIDPGTFSRKMQSNALTFSIGEMHCIADALSLSKDEASEIFLQQNSQ